MSQGTPIKSEDGRWMVNRVVRRLPGSVRRRFRGYLETPPAPINTLQRQVDAHVRDLEMLAARGEINDVSLAHELGERCQRLLSCFGESKDETRRQLVQAAVRNFVSFEDATNDVFSLVGLVDDAIVIIEVETVLA